MKTILVNDVLAYIVMGRKEVFLSAFGDKKQNVQVKKEIDKPFSELVLGGNEFRLRLSVKPDYEGVSAYVMSPKFPNPEEWYKVKNYLEESSYQVLSEVENDNGEFPEDIVFEAGFVNNSVAFLCSKMSNYKAAMDEMTRRFYIEVGKKTKKWIPGHRYDCAEGTYYYLGKYLSKKKEEFNSTFYNTHEELKEVYIYAKSLGNGEKKISEVFRNGKYGKDLFVFWNENFPSCVDSGVALTDDNPSLHDLWPEMFKNATPDTITPDNLKTLFDTLCYQSYSDALDYPRELTTEVKGIIKVLIKNVIFNNWNIERTRKDREIGDKVDKKDNIERIKSLLLNSIGDGNILSRYYYEGLFKALSINLDDEIEDWLKGWKESDLSTNFDTFTSNIQYFLKRIDIKGITSTQRTGDKIVKISDLFGKEELGVALIDLVNHATNNFGEGVSDFNAVKINRTMNSYACTITLEDLIKFRNTEELREDILRYKFSKIIVYFDKDQVIE